MDYAFMIEAFFRGLALVFEWPSVGYLFGGALIGLTVGAIPGLGGIIGLFILLPFTYQMDPVPAFSLLLGMFAVVTTGDTIASVMLGIPGTAASQATIVDGYPLAQKGQAARAFGAAFTVSGFGGVFGALILAVSLPLIMPIILSFSSPEMFMVGILGLAMVGSLSGGTPLKGLVMAMVGLLMSAFGYAESFAIPRYSLGTDYLLDGLPIVTVALGLFALPELMDLALKNTSISKVSKEEMIKGSVIDGIKDVWKHKWLALRCSVMGTYIGILPGLGAGIVDWIAYGHAVQSAKDSSRFGKGDIRGVIAPEAANNAIKGGVLVPTIAFGIPGGLGAAILLGAMLIQGLRPGPEMLTTNLHITFSLVWMIALANIVGAVVMLICGKQVAKAAFIPGHLIVPGVMMFLLMGAWIESPAMGSWAALLFFGALGFVMKIGDWPRPPIILAMILGNFLENYFQLSVGTHDGYSWLGRPIVLIIIVLIVLTLSFSTRAIMKKKKEETKKREIKKKESLQTSINGKDVKKGRSKKKKLKLPAISFLFSITLCVFLVWAGIKAFQWPIQVRIFPLIAIIPAIIFLLPVIYFDLINCLSELKVEGNFLTMFQKIWEKALLTKALQYFLYLFAVVLLTFVVGQKIVLPLFLCVYLVRWGKFKWRASLGYAFVGWLVLIGFYDQTMHLVWHPAWISSIDFSMLPKWFPEWLFI